MSQPFFGEIKMFGGSFAPAGWALCNGQQLAISENDALFTLIGTTYGGDGEQTFNLPDLRGRVPLHITNGFLIGQNAGTEIVTLTVNQIPSHTHIPQVAATGGSDSPSNNVWGGSLTGMPYAAAPSNTTLNPASLSQSGGSQAHDNMIPFVAVNYIICLAGIFPTPN